MRIALMASVALLPMMALAQTQAPVSSLPSASSVSGADTLVINQGGATKKTTVSQAVGATAPLLNNNLSDLPDKAAARLNLGITGTGGGGVTGLTGDVVGTGTGTIGTSLAAVNASPGDCGDATHIAKVTVDAKGRVISCAPVSTYQVGTLAARPAAGAAGVLYFATDKQQLFRDTGSAWVLTTNTEYGTFAARPAFGTAGRLYVAVDTNSTYLDTGTAWVASGSPGITGLSGDATATGSSGTVAVTLATVNSAPGAVGDASHVVTSTIDAKGRVTAATSVPIAIVASQVTNLGSLALRNSIASNDVTSALGYVPTVVTQDLMANRPGTASAGALFLATDTQQLFRYSGSAWALATNTSYGTAAARPAAGVSGRTYVATDTGVVSYDNGSAWIVQQVAAANVTGLGSLALKNSLASSDVTGGLGFTPVNPSSLGVLATQAPPVSAHFVGTGAGGTLAVTSVTSADVVGGLGFTPANASGQANTLAGDATGVNNAGTINVALATVNSAPGVVGDASHVVTSTIDAKGRVTAAAPVAISIPSTQVTGLGSLATRSSIASSDVTGALGFTPPQPVGSNGDIQVKSGTTLSSLTVGSNLYVNSGTISASPAEHAYATPTWNAATNTPILASGTSPDGLSGTYLTVTQAGSVNLDGITSWGVGDTLIINGSPLTWKRRAFVNGGLTPAGSNGDIQVKSGTGLSNVAASAFVAASQIGATSTSTITGIAPLGTDGKVAAAKLPTAASGVYGVTQLGTAGTSGVALAANDSKIVNAEQSSSRNAAGGLATLDSSTHLAATYLPAATTTAKGGVIPIPNGGTKIDASGNLVVSDQLIYASIDAAIKALSKSAVGNPGEYFNNGIVCARPGVYAGSDIGQLTLHAFLDTLGITSTPGAWVLQSGGCVTQNPGIYTGTSATAIDVSAALGLVAPNPTFNVVSDDGGLSFVVGGGGGAGSGAVSAGIQGSIQQADGAGGFQVATSATLSAVNATSVSYNTESFTPTLIGPVGTTVTLSSGMSSVIIITPTANINVRLPSTHESRTVINGATSGTYQLTLQDSTGATISTAAPLFPQSRDTASWLPTNVWYVY